jgi:hypothetical protein
MTAAGITGDPVQVEAMTIERFNAWLDDPAATTPPGAR